MIEIVDIYKKFDQNVVLDGVSMTIPDGETFCIIGKSGTGKSVLLKHIVGLLAPDKGYIKVDNQRVDELTQKQIFLIRTSMGYVFQGAALFDSLTVFENVVLGLYELGERNPGVLEKEAIRVLAAVNLLPEKQNEEDEYFRREWEILSNKTKSH